MKGQAMPNIGKLLRRPNTTITKVTVPMKLNASTFANCKKSASISVTGMVQFVVTLLWPVLKWLLTLDVT